MPVVTRVTGCVVCAVLVARGPYEGTVLTAIRVVGIARGLTKVETVPVDRTYAFILPPRSLLYQLFAPRSGRGRAARAGLEPLVSRVPAWAPPGLGASRPGGASRCHDRGRHRASEPVPLL